MLANGSNLQQPEQGSRHSVQLGKKGIIGASLCSPLALPIQPCNRFYSVASYLPLSNGVGTSATTLIPLRGAYEHIVMHQECQVERNVYYPVRVVVSRCHLQVLWTSLLNS